MDGDLLTLNRDVRAAEMLERGHHGYARGVDKGAVVGEEVHVCADLPALLSSNDTEGFGV